MFFIISDNQIVSIECGTSDYGCCPDGQTSASGPNQEGCPDRVVPAHSACRSARYGCCEDGSTFATGPNKQGCPGSTPTPTDCRYSAYGCCPGTTTAAAGPGGEGCRGRSDAARSGFDTGGCFLCLLLRLLSLSPGIRSGSQHYHCKHRGKCAVSFYTEVRYSELEFSDNKMRVNIELLFYLQIFIAVDHIFIV